MCTMVTAADSRIGPPCGSCLVVSEPPFLSPAGWLRRAMSGWDGAMTSVTVTTVQSEIEGHAAQCQRGARESKVQIAIVPCAIDGSELLTGKLRQR